MFLGTDDQRFKTFDSCIFCEFVVLDLSWVSGVGF